MSIKILEMTSKSAEAAAEIEAQCFHDPWSYESFLKLLTNQSALKYTALDDGKVIGYALAYDIIDEISIINIATAKDSRNKGAASALIKKIEEYAALHSVPEITLEVRESNLPAINLYKKLGYRYIRKENNYYTHPREDALIYSKEIHQ